MTMRDLQSVLFETRTRSERVAGLLAERRTVLTDMIRRGPGRLTLSTGHPVRGDQVVLYFRCTLVAADDLQLRADDLTRQAALIRPRPGGATPAFGHSIFHMGWHPRLHGVETIDSSPRHFSKWFFGDRGIVDVYGLLMCDTYRQHTDAFPPSLFPPVALQVLALGERLRRVAGRPEVELVMDCEFIFPGIATAVAGDGRPFDDGVQITEPETRIGPFSLGNLEDWRAVFAEVERGIWNACGMRVAGRLDFPLEQWLAEMGAA